VDSLSICAAIAFLGPRTRNVRELVRRPTVCCPLLNSNGSVLSERNVLLGMAWMP
jgi:hypothetical protein